MEHRRAESATAIGTETAAAAAPTGDARWAPSAARAPGTPARAQRQAAHTWTRPATASARRLTRAARPR